VSVASARACALGANARFSPLLTRRLATLIALLGRVERNLQHDPSLPQSATPEQPLTTTTRPASS
jgi:hypothetical protein